MKELYKSQNLKALFTLAGQDLQPAFFAISVYQTAADWTRAMNNQRDPVFQDCVLTEHLQQLPSSLLFFVWIPSDIS